MFSRLARPLSLKETKRKRETEKKGPDDNLDTLLGFPVRISSACLPTVYDQQTNAVGENPILLLDVLGRDDQDDQPKQTGKETQRDKSSVVFRSRTISSSTSFKERNLPLSSTTTTTNLGSGGNSLISNSHATKYQLGTTTIPNHVSL